MNNKNIFWIKVKNSSTVSNIFSSTILGQLRKESIYDYGKTNSFVFNKFFDDKKSFWVEAKDHQDIIELIEILSQEFSTPILALWNKKYIAYNSIGRRIEVESEFEKDYCLVASILEESTGYSFDADKFFEDENENDENLNEIDDTDDIDDDNDDEDYFDDSEYSSEENSIDYEEKQKYCDEEEFNFKDDVKKPCGKDCRCVPYDDYFDEEYKEVIDSIDDSNYNNEENISFENNDLENSCGQNCGCTLDEMSEEEFNFLENEDDDSILDDVNIIDEIKKETINHSEKVINLCDEILKSNKLKKEDKRSNCGCVEIENFDLDDSVNIEDDEYVCNGSCSKNIEDFGFFFEENNSDNEEASKTLFDLEIDVKSDDTFEVKDEQKNEENFVAKIEEEKKNVESTFFNLEDKQEDDSNEKYDFIVETIENIDNFLNDKSSTEINIEFDLDKEIENESFEELEEDVLSSKMFSNLSEKSFNDFFVVEENTLDKKDNEVDFSDKKKSFDVNVEDEEKVLEDFFSIINESKESDFINNESFENKTIKNLTLDENDFNDILNENVLDNVFESLDDQKEENENNDLLNNLFSNDEVNTKTNEIDLDELLTLKEKSNEETSLNDTNIENEKLLNNLFLDNEENIDINNDLNLESLLEKKENSSDEISLDDLKIDNDALFDENNGFIIDENDNFNLANENIDFESINNNDLEISFNEQIENNEAIYDETNIIKDNNVSILNEDEKYLEENLSSDEFINDETSTENNVFDVFEQIEKVEDSLYDIYKSNENSYSNEIFTNVGCISNQENDIYNNDLIENNIESNYHDDNLNIDQAIFNVTNDLLIDSNEHVVEEKNTTLYDVVLNSEEIIEEIDKVSTNLENDISISNEETSSNFYKNVHEKNKKISDELNIFLDELKKEKDLINNREEVILKREKKLKEIMNSDYAKNINIDSSNRKWRVIR